MRKKFCWFILLLGGVCGLLSCLAHPEQPNGAQPYARLILPEAIRLVALDNQTFDARLRLRAIQVTPGSHNLHFAYAGTSRAFRKSLISYAACRRYSLGA
jgi:hypothetical protein